MKNLCHNSEITSNGINILYEALIINTSLKQLDMNNDYKIYLLKVEELLRRNRKRTYILSLTPTIIKDKSVIIDFMKINGNIFNYEIPRPINLINLEKNCWRINKINSRIKFIFNDKLVEKYFTDLNNIDLGNINNKN